MAHSSQLDGEVVADPAPDRSNLGSEAAPTTAPLTVVQLEHALEQEQARRRHLRQQKMRSRSASRYRSPWTARLGRLCRSPEASICVHGVTAVISQPPGN
jgi:hypothetical protein